MESAPGSAAGLKCFQPKWLQAKNRAPKAELDRSPLEFLRSTEFGFCSIQENTQVPKS